MIPIIQFLELNLVNFIQYVLKQKKNIQTHRRYKKNNFFKYSTLRLYN